MSFSTKKSTIISLIAGSSSTTTMRTAAALDGRFEAASGIAWPARGDRK
jgi:hypothetical protein